MWSPPNVKAVSWSKSMMISFGIAVLVVSLPVILQQVPPYYSKLVWGTIMIIVGSAGSQLLPEWKRHKWLKWIRAVCIAIVIAVGALLTTNGWNERTVVHQRDGIIRSVAAELTMNMAIWMDSQFTETDDEKLKKYVVFPRMQTTALAGALSSGLFTEEKDRVFLTLAAGLNQNLLDFNGRLILLENIMAISPNTIYEFRTLFRDGKLRKSVGVKLQKFGTLLLSDYGIKSDETFFVKLND